MELNVEYKSGTYDAVTLLFDNEGTQQDVGQYLILEGHALAEKRGEKRLQSLVSFSRFFLNSAECQGGLS